MMATHMATKMVKKKKVFVGLSGGVDSAVSAALLQHDYDVTGVFIKVWSPDFLPCTWREDRLDAMRVCAYLDIPFITLDLEKEYKQDVVDYMVLEYKKGRTPNPDVMCNKQIKFGAFYEFARKQGADCIATGHYIQKFEKRNLKNEIQYTLKEAEDDAKEQSYFLWNIKKEQLPHVLFPIGGFQKEHVRKLAKKFGLPNAEKKDSQGLCFIGKVDMKEFLSHFITEKEGSVLDVKGNVIGKHPGVTFFTIGQRHGFTTFNTDTKSKPLYVVEKNIQKNTITVSSLKKEDLKDLLIDSFHLSQTNWMEEPKEDILYNIRLRYHQTPIKGTIKQHGEVFTVQLNSPVPGISIGQSAVFYRENIMIGGGIIEA